MSCQHEDGRVTARAWPWPAAVRVVAATPQAEVATDDARRILPQDVALRDAVFNLQHALLLAHAVRSGEPEALRDRWHQPARARLVPGLAEALALEHAALLGICLSGAGPSLAAFAAPGGEPAALDLLREVSARLPVPCRIGAVGVQPPLVETARPWAAAHN